MKKTKMTDFIEPFLINDDYAKKDNLFYFFYRIFPPNISTMTQIEKQNKVNGFYNILKNIELNKDRSMQIVIIDKSENLNENIKYVRENIKPQYDYVRDSIIEEISKPENQNNAIQRAFYIVVSSKTIIEQETFTNNAKENGLLFEQIHKSELISFMRSFFLREFGNFDIAGVEKSSAELFELQKNKRKAKTKETIYGQELLKRILPTKMVANTDYISQGNFLRQTLLIKNMPASFETLCLLKNIAQLEKTTMNIRICDMNKAAAIDLVNKQLKGATSSKYNATGIEKIEAEKDAEVISDFYGKFIDDKDKMFYINIFIELYGKNTTELQTLRDKVTSRLSPITYEVLKFDMINGFKGVFPLGQDTFKPLRNNIPGRSLAALYPFSYSSRNDKEGLLLGKTEDGGYMFVDFWLRNQFITNGSYIILGESGYGKSYLQKKIINQYIARGYTVFIFDNENEYSELVTKMGGTNINAISNMFKINPFQVRNFGLADNEIYETYTMKIEGQFFQHLSWLKEFIKVLIPELNGSQLSVLMTFIKDMYEFHKINDDADFSNLSDEDYPTFTDLYKYIEKVAANKDKYAFYKMVTQQDINNCLVLIKEVYDGSLSPLFNGHTKLVNSNIINFNIQQLLMGSSERTQAYLFNIMTYIWSRITQRSNRTLMCVDELYLLCNPNNMIIVKYLRDFIKRVRKYDAVIGTATQQIADCMDPKIYTYTSALFNVPAFKFMFNCGDMDYENIKRFLSLTEGEQEQIKNAQKKHCLLKAGASDKYMMKVGTLPYEEMLFGKAGGR